MRKSCKTVFDCGPSLVVLSLVELLGTATRAAILARFFISHSTRDSAFASVLFEWLRERGYQQTFLDFDKHLGFPLGSDWERVLYREITQSDAIILVLTPNWFESKWCFLEFGQARALGKAVLPIIISDLEKTLVSPDIQHLDLVKDRKAGMDQLAVELARIDRNSRGDFRWDFSRPPFPGLLAYDEDDAAVYFGRDDDIKSICERLNAKRTHGGSKLLLLLGASGAGKSSLMRAGIIPRLRRDKRRWITLSCFRAQSRPVDELAQVIALALGPAGNWRAVRELLTSDNPSQSLLALARDLRAFRGTNDAQILISIDQGEALFTATDQAETELFLKLMNVLLSDDMPFTALMGLRSDHLAHVQQARGLKISHETISLKPIPLERVRDVIEGPARVAELTVEDDLISEATRDATTDDALPLLALALRELYDRFSRSRRLTVEAYRALGDQAAHLSPIENAVRRKADEVLKEVGPTTEQLDALRNAFIPAMVRVNSEGEYVSRTAALGPLPQLAKPLIERLANARLLVLSYNGGTNTVEVAHEALLRKWPLLRGWLDQEREFLIGKEQFDSDFREWRNYSDRHKDDLLLSGAKLKRARAWLQDRPNQLTVVEKQFINESTAHNELIGSLRERNAALQAADQMKADFVHHVSYELRAPLTTIIGFTHFLSDPSTGPLTSKQAKYLDYVTKSTNALLALTSNILDLANIDAGAMKLELGPVNIVNAVEAAAEGIQDRLATDRIELKIEIDPHIGNFTGDERRVVQVLYNLLANAVGFSPHGAAVTISAWRTEHSVIFDVSDRGPGIPADMKDKVFDWFESRSHGSRHRGAGLGLSLVRSFVELHGGKVRVYSVIGKGTTVTCEFPIFQGPDELGGSLATKKRSGDNDLLVPTEIVDDGNGLSTTLDRLAESAHQSTIDIRPTLLKVLTHLYTQTESHSNDEERKFVELAGRLIDQVDDVTFDAVRAQLDAYPGTPAELREKIESMTLRITR